MLIMLFIKALHGGLDDCHMAPDPSQIGAPLPSHLLSKLLIAHPKDIETSKKIYAKPF